LRKPILRPPDKHELGYNTIVFAVNEAAKPDTIAAGASFLKLKQEDFERLLAERVPLPIARTASREEAQFVSDRLAELGFEVLTLADEGTVVRVRSLSLADAGLVINPGQATNEIDVLWSNIVLIVSGRLIEKRVEVKEVKTRHPENEILDTSELFSDEAVIDLYASTNCETWRIGANGFDFSCLGSEKSLLANENFTKLRHLLTTRASTARVDDSYNRRRSLLDLVWGAEQETKSSGWRRERPGKLSIGMATIHSNENQFTRYSRLLYYLTTHDSN